MQTSHGPLKRAAVLAAGSGGDVAPLAEVAARLAARGLATTLLAPGRYAGMVEGTPVGFVPIGADDRFAQVFDGPEVWDPARGLAASWRYYGAAARSGLATLRGGWDARDTLLVASSFAVAARLAEELDGWRNTTVHLSPAVLFSYERPPRWPKGSIPAGWPRALQRAAAAAAERWLVDPVIAAQLDPLRAELGLARERRLFSRWIHSPRRVVYAFPEWFAPAAADWPVQGRFAAFPQRGGSPRPLPPQVEAFLGRGEGPVVVVTAGTAVAARPAWVDRVCTFAVARGARVIVVETAHAGAASAPSVCRVGFAPFETLLPRVQLLVHHAGIGTAAEALRAGIAQWVVPAAHDQPDNADRLQRLGLAWRLAPAAGDAALAAAWRWAFDDPARHAAVAQARRRIHDDGDGAERIAVIALADAG